MEHIVIVIDPNDKNVVRGAFEVPSGMDYEVSDQLVKQAYKENDDNPDVDMVDLLEAQGFTSVAWLVVDLSDTN